MFVRITYEKGEKWIAAALRPRNFEKRNKNKPKLRTQKYPSRNCERKNTPSKLRTRSVKQSIEQESDTEEGIAAALRPRNFGKKSTLEVF